MMDENEISRERLEAMALEACSPEIYYELLDHLGLVSEYDLWKIVRGNIGYGQNE